MGIIGCMATASFNAQHLPFRENTRTRVLHSSVRPCTASLKSPLLSRGGSSFLPATPLTNPQNLKTPLVCKATKSSFIYPKLTTKPKWWWRTLASIPYLYPLHNVWQYADAIYQLHHILEKYEYLTFRFLDTVALLPSWVIITVFMGTYFLVVRRKEWPHFLRFHVAMALLLDTGLQVLGQACNWLPKTVYKQNFMVYFWITVAFLQGYTVLECMRCALCGMYSNVPFVSDTAFIHSDPKMMS